MQIISHLYWIHWGLKSNSYYYPYAIFKGISSNNNYWFLFWILFKLVPKDPNIITSALIYTMACPEQMSKYVKLKLTLYIEANIKLTPFWRQNFHTYFFKQKCLNSITISPNFIHQGQNNNKSAHSKYWHGAKQVWDNYPKQWLSFTLIDIWINGPQWVEYRKLWM